MEKFDFSKLSGIDTSKFLIDLPQMMPKIPSLDLPEIAEEDTIWYRMEKQYEILRQQLEQQNKNNELLTRNYNQLKELFDLQKSEFESAKAELVKSKRLNKIMLLIAIIAMLGAIASPLVTWLVTL